MCNSNCIFTFQFLFWIIIIEILGIYYNFVFWFFNDRRLPFVKFRFYYQKYILYIYNILCIGMFIVRQSICVYCFCIECKSVLWCLLAWFFFLYDVILWLYSCQIQTRWIRLIVMVRLTSVLLTADTVTVVLLIGLSLALPKIIHDLSEEVMSKCTTIFFQSLKNL